VYTVEGKRRMRHFPRYGEAKQFAGKMAKDWAKGNRTAALTGSQANEALLALERLQKLYSDKGKRFSISEAVGDFCDVVGRLEGHSLREAVEGFLKTAGTVKRKALAEAVKEFMEGRETKVNTVNAQGRSQLDPKYVSNTRNWLNDLSGMFPGHAVCDLSETHLKVWAQTMADLSPKSRNDRRGVIKLFLKWCEHKEQRYLDPKATLREASALELEDTDDTDTDFYRPNELRLLLVNAEPEMRAVIALQAFGGLRLKEVLRLDWQDVFSRIGNIEISKSKAKTRSRRLVAMCPALQAWLEPYRNCEGKVCTQAAQTYDRNFRNLRERVKVPSRRNGLRHGFCTFHFSLHKDENLTAALAGHSPKMLYEHYKGLATEGEAQKWFNTMPTPAENILPMAQAANDA
jgi:integrase